MSITTSTTLMHHHVSIWSSSTTSSVVIHIRICDQEGGRNMWMTKAC